jgi:hypothetical protein
MAESTAQAVRTGSCAIILLSAADAAAMAMQLSSCSGRCGVHLGNRSPQIQYGVTAPKNDTSEVVELGDNT